MRERVTGAMDARCGGTLLEISGVDCAYGVACCSWDEGGSGGIAVMAPVGIFQSKSGEGGISLALNSNGICSKSMGFEEVAGWFGVCLGVFWVVSPVGVLLGCCGVCTLRAVVPPLMGRSLRAWKLRGLLPRTIIAPEWTSHIGTLTPFARVAITFNRTTKCC